MLDKLTDQLDFQSKALVLRGERQRVIASNIANADTPGYTGRDFNFAAAMKEATGSLSDAGRSLSLAAPQGGASGNSGSSRFIPTGSLGGSSAGHSMGYTTQSEPSVDGNSVDLDRERAAFADNAVHYEATLRFINGAAKTMLSAIQGQ